MPKLTEAQFAWSQTSPMALIQLIVARRFLGGGQCRFRFHWLKTTPGFALTVSDLLAENGFLIEIASNGQSALDKVAATKFDLIVLDWMLPKLPGIKVCRRRRETSQRSAILMLTARGEVRDRVDGLQTGADDYLTKPFHPDELLARVHALLRRFEKEERPDVKSFQFSYVTVDFDRGEITKAGKRIAIGKKELQLLRYLITNRERLSPARNCYLKYGSTADVESRTLDVQIAWLRQKLEDSPEAPRHIHTLRGKGYRFTP